jgi:uncharacterized membrane protein YvbJ
MQKIVVDKQIMRKSITAISVLGLLIIFFSATTLMYSKEKQIAVLAEAVINSDVNLLRELLSSEESSVKITEENVETLVAYLDNFKKDKESLLEAIKNRENHELLSLKTEEKWFFFEEYAFVINPYYIEFEVDEYIKEIEIAGVETLNITEEGIVRSMPLFPKTYEIHVSYKTEYIPNYKAKRDIVVSPVLANDQRIVKAKVQTQSITLDIFNGIGATVLLNGKETNIKLDGPNKKIHGIPTDGATKVSIKKTYPWGDVVSEEHSITRKRLAFEYSPVNEQVKSDIILAKQAFSESFNEAFQKRDASLLKHVTPYMRSTFEQIIDEHAGREKLVSSMHGHIEIHELYTHEIKDEYELPKQEQYFGTFGGYIGKEESEGLYTCSMYYDLTEQKWLVFSVLDINSYYQ